MKPFLILLALLALGTGLFFLLPSTPEPATETGPEGSTATLSPSSAPSDLPRTEPPKPPLAAADHPIANPNSTSAFNRNPKWSPDGSRLLYTSNRNRLSHLILVSFENGHPRLLTPDPIPGGGAEWSPDGRWIVYTGHPDGDEWELYLMSSDGQNRVRLTDNDVHDGQASWAPDSQRFAFISQLDRYDTGTIFTMHIDGTGRQPQTERDVSSFKPTWGAGDAGLVFLSTREDLRRLYRMKEPGGPVEALSDARYEAYAPMVSNDGKTLLFNKKENEQWDLLHLDLASGEITQLTDDPLHEEYKDFSPDDRQVVFGIRQGPQVDLFLMDIDGGGRRQITDVPGRSRFPQWSPDGRFIAFDSDRSGSFEIYLMEVETGRVRALTDGESLRDVGAKAEAGASDLVRPGP